MGGSLLFLWFARHICLGHLMCQLMDRYCMPCMTIGTCYFCYLLIYQKQKCFSSGKLIWNIFWLLCTLNVRISILKLSMMKCKKTSYILDECPARFKLLNIFSSASWIRVSRAFLMPSCPSSTFHLNGWFLKNGLIYFFLCWHGASFGGY